jgi:hypothetical protein
MSENTRGPVERSLAATAPVEERDYYTFTVRFEALQQVADLLSALREKARRDAN